MVIAVLHHDAVAVQVVLDSEIEEMLIKNLLSIVQFVFGYFEPMFITIIV